MNETDRLVEPQQVDIVYETDEPVTYEVIDHVAWIMMNRPGFNNAQNGQMTYALDDAFVRAVNDDDVRSIVLGGDGKHFSAGHDIVATDDAFLQNPVNRMGVPGVEYFAHAYELPPRVAKEFLKGSG